MKEISNSIPGGAAVRAAAAAAALLLALLAPGSAAVGQAAEEPGAAEEGGPETVSPELPAEGEAALEWQDSSKRQDELEKLLATPPEGEVYTYKDGEYTRKVYLQEDFVVARSGLVSSRGRAQEAPGGAIVSASSASGLPVFRSPGGDVMTLPGGVLVIFEATRTADDIDAFFAARNIAADRLSPLGEIPNGFVVATDPGFPSLELAKALAEAPGIKLASPNWGRHYKTK